MKYNIERLHNNCSLQLSANSHTVEDPGIRQCHTLVSNSIYFKDQSQKSQREQKKEPIMNFEYLIAKNSPRPDVVSPLSYHYSKKRNQQRKVALTEVGKLNYKCSQLTNL